jgi:hypothetical protein
MLALGGLWRESEAFLRRQKKTAPVFENSTANVQTSSPPGSSARVFDGATGGTGDTNLVGSSEPTFELKLK